MSKYGFEFITAGRGKNLYTHQEKQFYKKHSANKNGTSYVYTVLKCNCKVRIYGNECFRTGNVNSHGHGDRESEFLKAKERIHLKSNVVSSLLKNERKNTEQFFLEHSKNMSSKYDASCARALQRIGVKAKRSFGIISMQRGQNNMNETNTKPKIGIQKMEKVDATYLRIGKKSNEISIIKIEMIREIELGESNQWTSVNEIEKNIKESVTVEFNPGKSKMEEISPVERSVGTLVIDTLQHELDSIELKCEEEQLESIDQQLEYLDPLRLFKLDQTDQWKYGILKQASPFKCKICQVERTDTILLPCACLCCNKCWYNTQMERINEILSSTVSKRLIMSRVEKIPCMCCKRPVEKFYTEIFTKTDKPEI